VYVAASRFASFFVRRSIVQAGRTAEKAFAPINYA
jgi:hypothetical protein